MYDKRVDERATEEQAARRPRKRANALDGKAWTRYSVSVWSDLRKTPEEQALKHPASFPVALAARLIECFCAPEDRIVLDPFCGIGSTLVAAAQADKHAVGVELSEHYYEAARRRLEAIGASARMIRGDARNLAQYLPPNFADLVVTSPPYWDVHKRKRSAARGAARDSAVPGDLAALPTYEAFLDALSDAFRAVFTVLKPGTYCTPVVMDLRRGPRFYPFHTDLAARMQAVGFTLEDYIIWDRRADYNRFRPLGYPSVFRVNKAHEYILVCRKPPVAAGE